MVPRNRNLADRSYTDTEEYRLDIVEERSSNTHAHEFAWLHEAWKTLPENIADSYPSPEHLRKRALIDCGYFHETVIDCGTNAAALRVASHLRAKDDFALVIVRGGFVIERIAKSQSRRAMKKQEFQESKTAIMDLIASLIGVPAKALEPHPNPIAIQE